jgi:hypothetical protein
MIEAQGARSSFHGGSPLVFKVQPKDLACCHELYDKTEGDPNQHASLFERARRRELEARRKFFTSGIKFS